MEQRPYDILTVFGNMVVRYDLAETRTTAYRVNGNEITAHDAPWLSIMLEACLSRDQIEQLDEAAFANEQIEVSRKGGNPFLTLPHQSHEEFLAEARAYLAA